jgi:hypothetical protein
MKEVICNNHNNCRDKNICIHSKFHERDDSCLSVGHSFSTRYYSVYGCTCCSIREKRKEKLEKLNEKKV